MNWRKALMLILSLLIGILLFVSVISLTGTKKIAEAFAIFSFYKYLLVFGLFFLIYLLTLARWGMTLNAMKHHVPFAKLLSIRLAEYAVGYITPSAKMGGVPVMAYLFKKECRLKYRQGLAVIVLNKIMDFTSGIIFSILGAALFFVMYGVYLSKKANFFIAAVVLILAGLIFFFYFKINRKEGFFSLLTKPFKKMLHTTIHKGILLVEQELHNFFEKEKKRLVVLVCISLIINLLTFINYKILALFLGINLSFVQLIMIFTAINIASMLPIPGALGSMEWSLALLFYLFGYTARLGVAFSLIFRSFELITTALGLLFLSHYGIKANTKLA